MASLPFLQGGKCPCPPMVEYVEEGKGEGRGKEKFAGGGVWRSDQAGQPKKGQGTMSLAGSRGGAPCGAWGNAPTAAPLDQLCQTRQFRSTSAEQRSAFSAAVVSLRVRRRAPQSALPITCTLSRRWARPDSMAKQNALREQRRSSCARRAREG